MSLETRASVASVRRAGSIQSPCRAGGKNTPLIGEDGRGSIEGDGGLRMEKEEVMAT